MRTRAVLLDALGTLLELSPPAPALRRELDRRFGLALDEATAQRAMAAEIAHYRAHHLEGRDPESLHALRTSCARVLRDALGPPAQGLEVDAVRDALLGALSFRAYPDASVALRTLRAGGARLVVVSNWDCSLPEVLGRTGLLGLVDAVLTSAQTGAAKPDPAIFRRALELAGAAADESLHVGNSLREDVEGARAAGVQAVLVARDGSAAPAGVTAVASLAELRVT